MSWSLGLSLGPGGVGSAVGLSGGGVHLIGAFPTIARAVHAATQAASGPAARVVLVHPAGLTVDELGRHLGDLALAALVLQVPETTTLVSTPRTAGALRRRPSVLPVLAALPVIMVLLLLLLL